MTSGSAETAHKPTPPGGLLLSGADDFDRQSAAAGEVIEQAKAGHKPGEGYFPKGESIVREVYDAGLTAALYGELGILLAGVSSGHVASTFEHTPDKDRPFKRLAQTALTFHVIFTGSREAADNEIDRVHRGHSRVKGYLREATRPHVAGTAYSAADPAMMLWTSANIGKPLIDMHEVLNGRLSDRRRDEFCRDFSRFGELFGTPREAFPQTYRGLQDYYDNILDSGEAHLTDTARYIGEQILTDIPVPPAGRLVRNGLVSPILLGALPERVRGMYGFPYDEQDQAAFRYALKAARFLGTVIPRGLRSHLTEQAFKSIIKTENQRVRDDQPHAVVPANPYI